VVLLISFRAVRIGTILFLLAGFAFTSTSALAYWREVNTLKDVQVTTIGSPVEIIVTDLNQGNESLRLVPINYAISVGDVERIELYYNVGVSRELLNEVELHINAVDVLINDSSTYSHLVSITIMGQSDSAVLNLFKDTLLITIVIELTEPIDNAEAIELGLDLDLINVEDSVVAYETINGQNISFILELELVQKEVIN
jgi:hypothetical protein